jgi:predicted nucleotidyltransferase
MPDVARSTAQKFGSRFDREARLVLQLSQMAYMRLRVRGMVQVLVDRSKLARFCRKHKISRLALFGSILSDRFRDDSDVDVLVEFQPGSTPGLFGIALMEKELSTILGRKVDLRTPEDLSRYFRQSVLAEAEVQYAQE